ncbi:hydroxysteroid 11-beta-dehydrogenase 1-like protein [Babylonia areolata]|uniref:hydroxysteroid 11-beta-dehydrogenase 1-like protein n=1 Tax=Babylonia areolata TaxID=304850 RepID=UPI003FD02909
MAHEWRKKLLALSIGAFIAYWFIDDFDPDSLRGKRVLVTGASTGIGEQLAYHYSRLGANVIVTARRQHALQKVVERCRELGPQGAVYEYVVADMANMSSADTVIQESVRQLGGLDVVVLNHILTHPLAAWNGSSHDLDLLRSLLDVNLRSYIHLASAASPWLRQSASGSLIVMASLAGKVGIPFVAAYSATKFALFGFFSSLRNELLMEDTPPFSITLCTIGLVGTQNSLHQLHSFGSKIMLNSMTPADPADVALAVVRGGALRQREVFVPYLVTKPLCLLRDWCPELVDILLRYFNAQSTDT